MPASPSTLAKLLESFKNDAVTLVVPGVLDRSVDNVTIEAVEADYVAIKSGQYEGIIYVPLASIATIRKV
jgi:hypothetical protein